MATGVKTVRPPGSYGRKCVWQLPVGLSHWINVLCLGVLFLTGEYIVHPQLSPSGEPWQHFLMGGARQLHFTFAFIFLVSFLWRVYWFWMGNNYTRSGFPFVWRRIWWEDLAAQARQYLRLDRGHVHLGHNALAGWIIPLLGGSFRTHMWHHLFSWGFLVFAVIHVYIVIYDSSQYNNGILSSIVSGHKYYEQGDLDHDRWLS
jgi:Ni/Fe-hydrogenase 1 B-type cytochrome subunit